MCVYVHTHTYTYTHKHTHTHTNTHTHIDWSLASEWLQHHRGRYMYLYTHTYIHLYIHTYIHIHTYTYTHTHTQTGASPASGCSITGADPNPVPSGGFAPGIPYANNSHCQLFSSCIPRQIWESDPRSRVDDEGSQGQWCAELGGCWQPATNVRTNNGCLCYSDRYACMHLCVHAFVCAVVGLLVACDEC